MVRVESGQLESPQRLQSTTVHPLRGLHGGVSLPSRETTSFPQDSPLPLDTYSPCIVCHQGRRELGDMCPARRHWCRGCRRCRRKTGSRHQRRELPMPPASLIRLGTPPGKPTNPLHSPYIPPFFPLEMGIDISPPLSQGPLPDDSSTEVVPKD